MQFLEVVGLLLILEHVVVRVEEIIQVVTRVSVFIEHLCSVGMNIGDCLVMAARIVCALS